MMVLPKRLLFLLFIVFFKSIDAQTLDTIQKNDSLLAPVFLSNGKAQLKQLALFQEPKSLENLYLQVKLPTLKKASKFVQNVVRIEVERMHNGKLERIEIARFFLPWLDAKTDTARFVFDISAYSSLFYKPVNLSFESNYILQTLELDLQFKWKFGEAPAKVNQIVNLWHSDINGLSYADKTKPINQQIKPKKISVSNKIKYAQLEIYLSGKGREINPPSESVCSKFYFLKANETLIAKRPIWRDDCSLNALFPQSGPWTYSRANWCPGQELRVFKHFIALGKDTTLNFSLQFQESKVASDQLQNYLLSANLILFEEAKFKNDAAVVEILAPNKNREHNRYNPICSSPVIRVRNTGTDTLHSVLIKYGLDNKMDNKYRWRGELAFMEEEIVYLPPLNWYFYDQKNKPKDFSVFIEEVNMKKDEYQGNNRLSSALNLAPVYPNKLSIQYLAHKSAEDNIIELVDDMGIPLFEATDFVNDSTYTFNLDLLPGCYEFIVYDEQGNGIYLPVNNAGQVKIIDTKTKQELSNFEPNFGAEIRQQFMILK